MKLRYFLFTLLITLVFFSCNVEKRLYRPGFYVPDRTATKKSPVQESSVENENGSVPVCYSTSIGAEKLNKTKEESFQSPRNISPQKENSLSVEKKFVPRAPSPVVLPVKKSLVKAGSSPVSGDVGDLLLLAGGLTFLLGLLLVLLAVSMAASAAFAGGIVVVGAGMMVVGFIIAGVGHPEIFFDVLLSLLFAL